MDCVPSVVISPFKRPLYLGRFSWSQTSIDCPKNRLLDLYVLVSVNQKIVKHIINVEYLI